MTRGQEILNYGLNNEIKSKQKDSDYQNLKLTINQKFLCSEEENIEHQNFLSS